VCASGAAPAGSLVDGKIKDAAAVALALRQVLARSEIRDTRAYVTVSDALGSFRVLKFPSATSDDEIDSATSREFPMDDRLATRWVDISRNGGGRSVYAVAWDKSQVKLASDVARSAGLDAQVVELKSLSVARTVVQPAFVLIDLGGEPAELFVVDDHIPQLRRSFEVSTPGEDIGAAIVGPVRQALRFYSQRSRATFEREAPILIAGQQVLSSQALANLSQLLDRPVEALPPPPRVPHEVRHVTYLSCLGMLMRRRS
jgi:hypothetical protein